MVGRHAVGIVEAFLVSDFGWRHGSRRPVLTRYDSKPSTFEPNNTLSEDVSIDIAMLNSTVQDYDLQLEMISRNDWDDVTQLLLGTKNDRTTILQSCLEAYIKDNRAVDVLSFLQVMVKASVMPTTAEYSSVVSLVTAMNPGNATACDELARVLRKTRQWKSMLMLVEGVESSYGSTFQPKTMYQNALYCCLEANKGDHAVRVLQSCLNKGIKPPMQTVDALVHHLSKRLQWRKAVLVLDLSQDNGIQRTLSMYNNILSATSKTNDYVQSKVVLNRLKRDGIQPDNMSYNCVLAACASSRRWREALSILDQLHRQPGVQPDVFSYTSAIRACARGGKTKKALSLFQVAKDKQLPLDTYCYTAAIDACAKASDGQKAINLLDEMNAKGIKPSSVTYSAVITACGNSGEWRKAMDMLDVMKTKKMSINLITYNSAITALSKAAKQFSPRSQADTQLWKKVLSILESIHGDGLEPDGFTYSAAITCYGAEGRWEETLELIKMMQRGGAKTKPNRVAYTAAIASCGKAGQADAALDIFKQMNEQGLSADVVAYNALFLALRVARRPLEAKRLWDEMISIQATTTSKAVKGAKNAPVIPDMITVTTVVDAVISSSVENGTALADSVIKQAIELGFLSVPESLQGTDTITEFDLSGMSLPVGRSICRYLLREVVAKQQPESIDSIALVTGTGFDKARLNVTKTTLREHIQHILLHDFKPNIASHVPPLSPGTVVIRKVDLVAWQQAQPTNSRSKGHLNTH